MTLRITSFTGEVPHLDGRFLSNSGAQDTFNVRLNDGTLAPFNTPRFSYRFPTSDGYKSIFKISDAEGWLGFTESGVKIVRGPVAQERLYISGTSDGIPKFYINGSSFPLAMPYPKTAPTAKTNQDPDADNLQEIVYAYTWVTDFDEESPPSPLTAQLKWSSGTPVTISGFEAAPTNRRISRMRLYRSQSTASGDTNLYFISERTVSVLDWVDNAYTLGEICPSINYDAAPAGLSGLISLPNGIMAGFIAGTNVLCFAEPWIPSAWPEAYQLTTDFHIVGIGAYGTTIVVLTTGKPYIVQGTTPSTMQMSRLDVNQPCISAESIVDLGSSVAYASPEGIVTVSASGVSIASKALFTQKQWQRLNPAAMNCAVHNGRYIAACAFEDEDGRVQSCGLVFDFSGEQPFVLRTDYADTFFYEIETGVLYMLQNGSDVYEYDPVGGERSELYWRSKPFLFPTPCNFGCILVETSARLYSPVLVAERAALSTGATLPAASGLRTLTGGDTADTTAAAMENASVISDYVTRPDKLTPAVAGATLTAMPFGGSGVSYATSEDNGGAPKPNTGTPGDGGQAGGGGVIDGMVQIILYGDGKEIATVTQMDRVVRLPARSMYNWLEMEVRATQKITAISLASQPSELAQTS